LRIDPQTPYAELLNIPDHAHRIYVEAFRILTTRQAHEPQAIHRARLYIEEHLTDDIKVGMVAKHVGLCPQQFRKRFKQSTGKTFREYLAHRRIERAKELLLDAKRKVADVAFEAGFQSLSPFYRAFRKHAGQTAAEYRRSPLGSRKLSGRRTGRNIGS
jgi:two-component system response regulator YesN